MEIILYRSLVGKEYFVALKGGASHADMWGKRFLDRENSQSKNPETGELGGYPG